MSESPARPAPSHTERTVGSTTVVTLSGEVDLAARLSLAPRLDVLTAGPRPDLVLDLRPVAFIDCAGLGLLCRARNRVAARGGRLRLVSDNASFRRILRSTGLGGVFVLLPEFGAAPATAPGSRRGPVVPAGQG
ncbi:STAS domain-containing protein [Streptomyces kebangsaanensis]|uniref:Anti-sigma factor antagonist n=1 Tax=Streptomyces kebangsaanensis TaxID=864058 RepID=A0ABW6KZQ6_9ACTN|nr:STAS domain-containing protein [Streptomyces kebangsaanensis]